MRAKPVRCMAPVHDVMNLFMCTGFTRDTGQYFMKASPVRAGDYLEIFAEIDLLAVLSACPGGDCSTVHSSDDAACYPLAEGSASFVIRWSDTVSTANARRP